jgi:hypothetical protein
MAPWPLQGRGWVPITRAMDTLLTTVGQALDGLGRWFSIDELAVALLLAGLSPRAARDWIHAEQREGRLHSGALGLSFAPGVPQPV